MTNAETPSAEVSVPHEPLGRLFLRFLRFGALAWGGPVVQIAMLRHSLVDEERWITSEHFNRVLALYQVLPGPEAHELCVYFGMLSRGRVGGALVLAQQRRTTVAIGLAGACVIALVAVGVYGGSGEAIAFEPRVAEQATAQEPSLARLFWAGLKAGSLTFGGAYTVIPFLQEDAVATGAWMSNDQFLDGVALGSLLPAPLIIFATFVGYLGGGAAGALVLTVGIFLPAFVLTLVGHRPMERLLEQVRIRAFLDGVTAAVVGLIAGTTVALLAGSIVDATTAAVFFCAVAAAFWVRSKFAVPLIVAAAMTWGLVGTAMAR